MRVNPFFSVVIPTKNRSHLVGFAVQSVLDQTFNDYEIILVDNDDQEGATRDVIAKFVDPRIKCYRTGNLIMQDNWDFGLSKTRGAYVTVLEDKMALYPDTLDIIYQIILSTKARVITWIIDNFRETEDSPIFIKYFGNNKYINISSEDILKIAVKDIETSKPKLPRLINSCISQDLIELIRNQTPGKRFFIDGTPDYCAAYTQLNYVDSITHVDRSLSVWHNILSTGVLLRKRAANATQLINNLGSQENLYNNVPMKTFFITHNCLINDFIKIKKLHGGRLNNFDINQKDYIKICYKDIMRSYVLGARISNELILLKDYIKSQNILNKKSLWPFFIKMRVMSFFRRYFVMKYLAAYPWLYNYLFKISGYPKRIYAGYANLTEIVRDKSLNKNKPGSEAVVRSRIRRG